jgi:hypothetical protein
MNDWHTKTLLQKLIFVWLTALGFSAALVLMFYLLHMMFGAAGVAVGYITTITGVASTIITIINHNEQ